MASRDMLPLLHVFPFANSVFKSQQIKRKAWQQPDMPEWAD
jgi:hypothetical protein